MDGKPIRIAEAYRLVLASFGDDVRMDAAHTDGCEAGKCGGPGDGDGEIEEHRSDAPQDSPVDHDHGRTVGNHATGQNKGEAVDHLDRLLITPNGGLDTREALVDRAQSLGKQTRHSARYFGCNSIA